MAEEIGNTEVTTNGMLVNVTKGMEIICPTCKGKGSVFNPRCNRNAYYYVLPQVTCRTCNGEGWVWV